ncbi:MAG: peptide chain release factor N(5)-glutamine methyltransferase [Pseudomonadota bacterium]
MSDADKASKERLKAAGIDNYQQEFRWLSDHASSSDKSLDRLVERRCAGEPLQHILGTTPFHAISLKTDKRALIPRSDSETIVDLALELLAPERSYRIADLGAGTGALLLAVLNQRPSATGWAVERSEAACELLNENINALGMSERADVFHGSWADWSGWSEADFIISNPPYIEGAIIPTLSVEVKDYDPLEALSGGPDGLDAYREIIRMGAQLLKDGTWLVMEIGYDQRDRVSELLEDHSFTDLIHRKDLGNRDRAIAARKT